MGRSPLAVFLHRSTPSTAISLIRRMSSQRKILSSNLSFVPATPLTLNKTGRGWQVKNEESRPLVLLFEYMNAVPKHIDKFMEFYIARNFDVLAVSLKPWQLFWPKNGSQRVARDVANFLLENDRFTPIVYHGFSVGGYLWGEVLKYFSDHNPRYQSVTQRVCGQIMDSGVDVTEIPTAFPKAVFPDRPIVRMCMEKFISFQMTTMYYQSTRHYVAARAAFGGGIIRGPTLFIYSDSDPLSTRETNAKAVKDLSEKNILCVIKEFKGSKHVMHYQKHKEEYLAEVASFLDRLKLNTEPILRSDTEVGPVTQLQAKL